MPQSKPEGYRPASRWIIGISGASGIIYALDLIRELARHPLELNIVLSSNAIEIMKLETNFAPNQLPDAQDLNPYRKSIIDHILYGKVPYLSPDQSLNPEFNNYHASTNLFFEKEFMAPIASGSYQNQGMVVIPCSMATLSRINLGLADNLLSRACEVTLKEARKLILVPRETPLSLSAIQNMLNLKLAGAEIVLPSPGFYHHPKNIIDLIHFISGKILNLMQIEQSVLPEWADQTS